MPAPRHASCRSGRRCGGAFTKTWRAQLRDAILDGRFRAGQKLPPERELAQEFRVNRTSVREAIKVLEGLGLVSVRQGDGATVQPLIDASFDVLAPMIFHGGRIDAAAARRDDRGACCRCSSRWRAWPIERAAAGAAGGAARLRDADCRSSARPRSALRVRPRRAGAALRHDRQSRLADAGAPDARLSGLRAVARGAPARCAAIPAASCRSSTPAWPPSRRAARTRPSRRCAA